MSLSPLMVAAPVITSVTGASNFLPATSSATATVYGGIAGSCTSPTSSATCNTCTDTTSNPPKACNPRSVHSNLIVAVNFTVSAALAGKRIVLQTEASSGTGVTELANQIVTGEANASYSLTTTWGAICAADSNFGGTNCDPASASERIVNFATSGRSLIVGADESGNDTIEDAEKTRVNIKLQFVRSSDLTVNEQTYQGSQCVTGNKGACGFILAPGDSKFYIQEFFITQDASGKPAVDSTSDPEWLGLAFFSAPGSAVSPADISSSGTPIIKEYDANHNISTSNLEGFENYSRYCVAMGNINKAYNIYYFATGAADANKTCGTPSEVVGALYDKNCFISTAAFGSNMAPEVEIFRQFRNKFLLNHFMGRQFVSAYYKYSPAIAQNISENDSLRGLTRAALYPALIFSKLSLKVGIVAALLIYLAGLFVVIRASKWSLRRPQLLVIFILCSAFQINAEVLSDSTKVKHPGAAEGLVKIRKDGSYVYDVEHPMKNQSSHLRLGNSSQPTMTISFEAKDSNGNITGTNVLTFDDFYQDAPNLMLSYDYEWFPWINKGMLGVQAGVSLLYADGYGRLKVPSATETSPQSQEKFTFLTVPMNLGAVYRLQWKNNQMIAPYVAGGGTYVGLAEKREDLNEVNFAGGFGFYASGGALINLTAFDQSTAFELNSEYGISNLWFSVEYRVTEVDSEQFGYSNQNFSGGLSFDF